MYGEGGVMEIWREEGEKRKRSVTETGEKDWKKSRKESRGR